MAVGEKIDDDPVRRMVDKAMEAQTRMMLAYFENSRAQTTNELIRQIKEEFGGEQQYISKGTAARNSKRNESIRRDARPISEGGMGMSMSALGEKYLLSKPRIHQILNDEEHTNEDKS